MQTNANEMLQNLDEIEHLLAQPEGTDFVEISAKADLINGSIERLIQEDKLKTASDFQRAAVYTQTVMTDELGSCSQKYQLLLTAVVLGDEKARRDIAWAWDMLRRSTGRIPHIHEALDDDDQILAPEIIQNIYHAASRGDLEPNMSQNNNAEIAKIVEEDQKARSTSWANITKAELQAIGEADRKRFKRIKKLVISGALSTAADFANAALVCQHGHNFEDFTLAHELCVCALLLGDKSASWLCGASYDRMLLSASYPQRFCTQFMGIPAKLQTYTNVGINDTMRLAVCHRSLAQAKEREKEIQ